MLFSISCGLVEAALGPVGGVEYCSLSASSQFWFTLYSVRQKRCRRRSKKSSKMKRKETAYLFECIFEIGRGRLQKTMTGPNSRWSIILDSILSSYCFITFVV